jgi:hypothetical protein
MTASDGLKRLARRREKAEDDVAGVRRRRKPTSRAMLSQRAVWMSE